jgi:hypothetical protein
MSTSSSVKNKNKLINSFNTRKKLAGTTYKEKIGLKFHNVEWNSRFLVLPVDPYKYEALSQISRPATQIIY